MLFRSHLPTKENCPLVKQKVRRMRPEMSEKIKTEVMKQFDAGFLAVTSYPQWVSNVVPVPKKDGKVRMCVDYRDLNRALNKIPKSFDTVQIRSRHGCHSNTHSDSIFRYSSDTLQTRMPS